MEHRIEAEAVPLGLPGLPLAMVDEARPVKDNLSGRQSKEGGRLADDDSREEQ